NERNSYCLRKRSEQPTLSEVETVCSPDSPGLLTRPARVGSPDPHISLESTTGSENGSALPSPFESEATASPEERGIQEGVVERSNIAPLVPAKPTEAERDAYVREKLGRLPQVRRH